MIEFWCEVVSISGNSIEVSVRFRLAAKSSTTPGSGSGVFFPKDNELPALLLPNTPENLRRYLVGSLHVLRVGYEELKP